MLKQSLNLPLFVLVGLLSCSQPRASRSAAAPATAVGGLRVAVCQIEVGPELESNFTAIDQALAQAAAMGAQIACFPETSLYGWVNPEAHQLADPIPGATSARIGALANEYGLMIAIGLAERDGGQLFDSAILVDCDGALLLKHRKVNILSNLMDPPYTPGDGKGAVVDTRFGRIGMLICADTFQDEVVAKVTECKPDLVLVPYGWAAPLKDWPDHGRNLQAWVSHTAVRTGAPVVGVDAVGQIHHGPWTGYLYGGQSVVCGLDGRMMGVLADRAAQVQVFDL